METLGTYFKEFVIRVLQFILNGMSKIYEKFNHNSLSSYAETILPNFKSVYQKSYSLNHVLFRKAEKIPRQ